MFAGMIARPRATSSRTNSGVIIGGNRRAERLAGMLARHRCGERGQHGLATQVLADRDELHLRRDDAAARVVHLRDGASRLRAARLAMEVEAQARQGGVAEAGAAVRRRRAVEGRGVGAFLDPAFAQGRQAAADVDRRGRVAVGSRGVVDDDRGIPLGPERRGRVALLDLPHWHAQIGARSLDVDLARARQRRDGGGVDRCVAREEFVLGVHGAPRWRAGWRRRSVRPLVRGAASLRRHYPDQVLRVSLTRPTAVQAAPAGPLASAQDTPIGAASQPEWLAQCQSSGQRRRKVESDPTFPTRRGSDAPAHAPCRRRAGRRWRSPW